jgi:hypothetical protein
MIVQHDLEQLIGAKDWAALRDTVAHLNPADVAEILVDVRDEDDAAIFTAALLILRGRLL